MQRTFRPIAGRDELDLFRSLPSVLDPELDGDLDAGRRRPEWLWMALDGDRVVAKAAWWSRAGDAEPLLMDHFEFAEGHDGAGEELVRTALAAIAPGATAPEYIRFIPPDWRDDPEPVRSRMAVLERLGARALVERLRLEWRPGAGIPAASGRLQFRSFSGTAEALDLMTKAVEGTLDAHHRSDLERLPPRAVAEEHLHGELVKYPSPAEWWRVATLPGGEPVGFVFPARNGYGPIIAYIGVLPEHRGRGYIDDVLAEGTRVLAEQDAPRIRATTDVGNGPMARAFARGGYDNYQNEINMVW
ncbi:GNAT family N-acetyltransferase [Dactylosporangium sp. CA-139066]|uniref:GNAT family N-acetyltransferase n=1 Tax=Dactylosporangium sp. CA-139066 TaxID=3239930 RepID=UPI003D921A8D